MRTRSKHCVWMSRPLRTDLERTHISAALRRHMCLNPIDFGCCQNSTTFSSMIHREILSKSFASSIHGVIYLAS